MTLMINTIDGDRYASLGEVVAVPVPQSTESYSAISNEALIQILSDAVCAKFNIDPDSLEWKLALAKKDQQLFGTLVIPEIYNDMFQCALNIAFRNSYNKSLSVGLAGGANCYVCSNLMIGGKVVELRRHTPHIWNDIREMVAMTVDKAVGDFKSSMTLAENLQDIKVDMDDSFKTIGLAQGRGLLKPQQASIVFQELEKPSHEEFSDKNAWSLYNHFTEGLKKGPAGQMIARHEKANLFFQREFLM